MLESTESKPQMSMNEIYKEEITNFPTAEESKLSDSVKTEDINKGHVDTAPPFESVKAAISKFGGINKSEAQKALAIEEMLKVTAHTGSSKFSRSASLKIDDCQEMLKVTAHTGSSKFSRSASLKIDDFQEMLKVTSHTGSSKFSRSASLKKDDFNRGQIDTAAPFESVKAAINKFRGFAGHEAQTDLSAIERQKIQVELEKIQRDILKCRKDLEAAEGSRVHVAEELDQAKRLVEELQLNLNRAETKQKEESQLADEKFKEALIETVDSENVQEKIQLQIAREIVEVELSSVKEKLESMEREFAQLVDERDSAVRKTKEIISASKEMENNIEKLTMEVVNTKKLLETANSTLVDVEEQRTSAAMAFEHDRLNWEEELKRDRKELDELSERLLQTNDRKSSLDAASVSLSEAKVELDSYKAAKVNLQDFENHTDNQTSIHKLLAAKTKQLEEARSNIEKANDEVNRLKEAASPLKKMLEMEKKCMNDLIRKGEALGSTLVPSLEAEIGRIKTELELVLKKKKAAQEKMAVLPKAIEKATVEANQATLAAKQACEELRKAEEKAELAKAEASTMEKRLNATLKETQAAKASETLANFATKAMEESEQASLELDDGLTKRVTLTHEEYLQLCKKADDAEALAKSRVISAIDEIQEAKVSESKSTHELEYVRKKIQEMKRTLRAAVEEADKAKREAAIMEKELKALRAKQGADRKASSVVRSLSGLPELEVSLEKIRMDRSNTISTASEVHKRRSKSFIPRIVMFFSKKKIHTVKD